MKAAMIEITYKTKYDVLGWKICHLYELQSSTSSAILICHVTLQFWGKNVLQIGLY